MLGQQQKSLHYWSYVRATDELPSQGAVNVERVFMVWRHHKLYVRFCPSGMCFMFCKMSSINWVELNQKSYQNIQASTELPALPIGHFPILFLFQRKIRILIKISLKFVPIRPLTLRAIARQQTNDKPLPIINYDLGHWLLYASRFPLKLASYLTLWYCTGHFSIRTQITQDHPWFYPGWYNLCVISHIVKWN